MIKILVKNLCKVYSTLRNLFDTLMFKIKKTLSEGECAGISTIWGMHSSYFTLKTQALPKVVSVLSVAVHERAQGTTLHTSAPALPARRRDQSHRSRVLSEAPRRHGEENIQTQASKCLSFVKCRDLLASQQVCPQEVVGPGTQTSRRSPGSIQKACVAEMGPWTFQGSGSMPRWSCDSKTLRGKRLCLRHVED